MQYLAWRMLAGLNNSITLSFLIVGHTKFSPDWCFGLFKQMYRRSKIGCLDDIARVIDESAVVNHAQLVGTQDGTVIVPTYNWAEYFDAPYRKTALKGIKSMHHLTFTRLCAIVKDSITGPEREINMVKDCNWKPTATQLPPIIQPPGLSQERKQYLFEKIREFCPPHCHDLVCPVEASSPALYAPTHLQKVSSRCRFIYFCTFLLCTVCISLTLA